MKTAKNEQMFPAGSGCPLAPSDLVHLDHPAIEAHRFDMLAETGPISNSLATNEDRLVLLFCDAGKSLDVPDQNSPGYYHNPTLIGLNVFRRAHGSWQLKRRPSDHRMWQAVRTTWRGTDDEATLLDTGRCLDRQPSHLPKLTDSCRFKQGELDFLLVFSPRVNLKRGIIPSFPSV